MTLPADTQLQSVAGLADDAVIDLRECGNVVRKHLLVILGFSCVVSLLVALVVFNLRPTYEGTATLLIEADPTNVVPINQVYDFGMGKSQYYATQFSILGSRENIRRVIERNRKAFETYFDREYPTTWNGMLESVLPSAENREDRMVDFFTNSLTITPVKDTQLVKISFDAKDAALAAALVNDLAAVYIEQSMQARLDMTRQATSMLAAKIAGLKKQLNESEQRLQEYREREGLVDVEGVSTLIAKELDETSTRLAEAHQARIEAENIVSQVDSLPDHNIDTLSSIPAVLKDSLVQKFKDEEGIAQQKLSALSRRYGDKHPKIIAAKSDLDTAKKNTADQILKVIDGIHKEYQIANATEAALTKQMTDLREKAQELNRKQYQLDALTHEVEVNRQLYDTFFNRVKETSEAMDIKTPNARVVDPATASSLPVRPKRGLLVFLALVLGFAGSVFFALLRESRNATVKNRDDIELKLQMPLLGVLPLIKDKTKALHACTEFVGSTKGAFAESVRTLRTGIVLSGLDDPHRILLVTSSLPGEGKTAVSMNLAAAFGQTGKTLLLEADMRRPAIAKYAGMKPASPGLSELLAGTATSEACIHRVEPLRIDVLPAGAMPPNPLELLSSARFAAMLANIEKNYDHVIIDSAPCEVVSDALVLSTLAGAVIYVVAAETTGIRVVKSGLARLRSADAHVAGAVLNRVNIGNAARDGVAGYGGYYDRYGYTQETPKSPEATMR